MVSRILHRWFARKVFLKTKRNLQPDKIQPVNKTYGIQQSCAFHNDYPPMTPTLTNSYVHGTCNMPLIAKTVGECLEETTSKYPDREAMVFDRDGIRKTFAQFNEEVDQLAAGLLGIGLKKGDCLGMWGPSNYGWLLMQFATAKAGIILVTVNPAYQAQELEYVLRKVGCKALVFPSQFKTQKYYELLLKACPEVETSSPGSIKSAKLPELRTVIVLDSKPPGAFHLDEVMQAGSTSYVQQLQELQKTLSFDDPICVQFTSGTTGSPKGATLSHHNIVNNIRVIGYRLGFDWRDTRICVPVPMYHCFGSVGGGLAMATFGSTIVFPSPSFEGKAVIETIHKEKCTVIYGTPTMYIDMLSQPDFSNYDMSSVETGIIAAAPIPVELFKDIMAKMHCPELIAKVVDTVTKLTVPVNTKGEVYIRGYCVMLGYWADPEKTKQAISNDRWYKTGDLATMDEYGYLKIVGRCSDMIIRGGENIYPAEIEQFLHTHPKIQEAQVIGVKDERMGEEVCACLRLKQGQEITPEEIKAFCKGQISHFKVPRYIVTVNSYPLTVSGKIQKYKLREEMEKRLRL
ncbi:medium-chain acyl-CoA ligase ACSF2, mitochondrial-like isoform X2 [Protopterus annectens]|uniref:medium-chain acyl-CoA ligase ACSF2, mitochondrial-like isoform X2 n=1 Tax=Protopterus annectens TaxID=7888 RepID=UPI001CF95A7A|nr:medium-chain acyl-CoA ligase ACSF2, mitochondrial-like isoform X2 [Protopterus annectens]